MKIGIQIMCAVCLLTGPFWFASSAAGQSLGFDLGVLSVDHWLVGRSLTGGAAKLLLKRPGSRVSGEFEFARFTGSANRTGLPCVGGPIQPGTCETAVLLRDQTRFSALGAGAAFTVLSKEHISVDLGGKLLAGPIRTETRSLQRVALFSAERYMWGTSAVARVSAAPFSRVPIYLVASASLGQINSIRSEQQVDGYTPFDNGLLRTQALSVGLVWLRR